LSSVRRWLEAIPHVAITLLMLVAIVDMLVGVFLRYVMTAISAQLDLPSVSFFWVEEVGEWSLAWMTFIAAAIGIRRGTHFAVQLAIERFPPGLRRALLTAHCCLIMGFGLIVAVFGWQTAAGNSQSVSPGLGLNLWWLYISAVAGGLLICLYTLATIVDVWRGRNPWSHAPVQSEGPEP